MSRVRGYDLSSLDSYSRKIEKIAASLGLNWYPQEFELIDPRTMMATQTYLGMPTFYPHWSFGKQYEITSTLYRHGLTYLPYELVINSNPCRAYLMKDNDLAMQILTMAHVYSHNNFFRNNTHFRKLTDADSVLKFFRLSAERIRSYNADPSIGSKAVERCINAANGLKEQTDLLLFLRDNSTRTIPEWEKDVITVIAKTFQYFKPQIMTKIMNEGWASFWHYKIIRALDLSSTLRSAIGNHHAKVVRFPDDPKDFNPYLVGFTVWEDIAKNHSAKMFRAVSKEEDRSFVEKYLTEELMIRLRLITSSTAGTDILVTRTADESSADAQIIKRILQTKVGLGPIPVIKVHDFDKENGALYLRHFFEGRNLEPAFTNKTLEYVYYFWSSDIALQTVTYRRNLPFVYTFDGTRHTARKKTGNLSFF